MSRKVLALGLMPSNNKGDQGDGPFLKVTSGEFYTGRYDEQTKNMIFWRGDTRGPNQVFATGFSSRYVRDNKGKEIVWRAGVDDIVPASAVCLARDVRGAAFFPYPPYNSDCIEDTNYLYAMTVPIAACTYRIQQVVENVETNQQDWRDPGRFVYDPDWSDSDNASCVWQFAEYAVHEVPKWRILAGWKCTRQILVKEKNDERVQAGIRFRLHDYQPNAQAQDSNALQAAVAIADEYTTEYPRKYPQFLSYWGIVEAMMIPAPNTTVAKQTARQIQPIVVPDDQSWNVRHDGGGKVTGTVKLGSFSQTSNYAKLWDV